MSCLICGSSSHMNWDCPIQAQRDQKRLQEEQNKILQKNLDLQKKAMRQQSGGSSSGGAFSAGTGFMGAIVTFLVHLYIIWPYQIIKTLYGMWVHFEEVNPELASKVKKIVIGSVIALTALMMVTTGIVSIYQWADSYNYGLVGFWLVVALIVGVTLLMIFSPSIREQAKANYKAGEESAYKAVNGDNKEQ